MTPEDLEDRKQQREFWIRVITTVLTALPGLFAAYFSYSAANSSSTANTTLTKADADRARIEEKIDTNHTAATEAVEHAKEAATEVKTAVAEVKAITDTMPRGTP